ncbi:40S ribosomal protein S3a-1 [Camellia lanceoleosa]|uniref:40S ribosomal protein S3a-1 n=1 Tax=Camellia lanceoleosa TaxID=1840588 RepID=A0ACC0I2B1_9ERIC|nr:40S ribosomal protein S3a-1 [Camellia lanceoleosa]
MIFKTPKFDLGKLMEVHGDYSTEDVGVKMERLAEEPVEEAVEVKSNEEGLIPMKVKEEKKRREQQRKAEESRGDIYLDARGRTRRKSPPPLLQTVCEPNVRARARERDFEGLCKRV